jgi:arabinogalactan oligomer/maltooligosaccharide transport system substrate-binding protein
MKRLVNILIVLTLIFSSTALFCGGQKEEVTTEEEATIVFWQTMNEQETVTLQSIVDEFETAHPNITIEMEYVPFGDAQNKFKIASSAGNAPDVIRAEIAWTPEFAHLGYLLELDEYISSKDKADYLKAPFAYNVYKGKIWGIPQVTDAPALLYNKRLLKEAGYNNPPKTLTEMEKMVANIKSKLGIEGFYMRGDAYWFQCFLWAFDGGLIDEDGNIFINNENSIKALEYVVNQKDKLFPGTIDFANDYNNAMALFKDGKVAMIINGPWATADVLSGNEFKDPSNFGVAPFPKGPGGKQGSPVGGHNYTISSGTLYPDAAYKFIEFINQPAYQARLAVKNNLIPTRKSTYKISEVKANEIVQGFLGQMEVATNRPVIPEGGQIYTAFNPNFQAAWRGEKSPKQALDDIASAWSELLGK